MAERPFTQADLDVLAQWDTPTICNGLEVVVPERRAIGFTVTGPQFVHRENGFSILMKLDLAKHGERLSREAGMSDYMRLYLKAKAFKLIARIHA